MLKTENDGGVFTKHLPNPVPTVQRLLPGARDIAESYLGASSFTRGLVLMVPGEGHRVELERGVVPMPDGLDVLLFDRNLSELRSWAGRFASTTYIIEPPRRRIRWRQIVTAVVVAAVWLVVMAVVGLALTPEHPGRPGSGVSTTRPVVAPGVPVNSPEPLPVP